MPSLSISRLDHANMVLTGLKNDSIRESKFWDKLRPGDPIHIFFRLRAAKRHKPKDYHGNLVHRLTPPDSPAICVGNYSISLYTSLSNDENSFDGFQINGGRYDEILKKSFKRMIYGSINRNPDDLNRLAKMDGFNSWAEMRKFFLPDRERFEGRLIMWEPLGLEPIKQKCICCKK